MLILSYSPYLQYICSQNTVLQKTGGILILIPENNSREQNQRGKSAAPYNYRLKYDKEGVKFNYGYNSHSSSYYSYRKWSVGKIHKRYYRLVLIALGSFFPFMILWDIFDNDFVMAIYALLIFTCGFLTLRVRCPKCGKPVIMPDKSLFNRIIPENKCSRCGYDLTQ